jgi:uncharacterized protein (TIGR02453 family)
VAEAFSGFPPSGIAFLAGLAADNTTTYFDRNRDTYASDVAAPLQALVVAVGERLRDRAGRDVCFDPTIGKSLFRINRDTRFSADKTQYNPVGRCHLVGRTPRRPPRARLHLPPQRRRPRRRRRHHGLRETHLDRYRAAVADDSSGRALHDLLNQLSATLPDVEITEPARKRVPAPYPQDHPRRDLLRCDSLHASVQRGHPRTLASPEFAATLTGLLTPFAQLHRWLVDHVTT